MAVTLRGPVRAGRCAYPDRRDERTARTSDDLVAGAQRNAMLVAVGSVLATASVHPRAAGAERDGGRRHLDDRRAAGSSPCWSAARSLHRAHALALRGVRASGAAGSGRTCERLARWHRLASHGRRRSVAVVLRSSTLIVVPGSRCVAPRDIFAAARRGASHGRVGSRRAGRSANCVDRSPSAHRPTDRAGACTGGGTGRPPCRPRALARTGRAPPGDGHGPTSTWRSDAFRPSRGGSSRGSRRPVDGARGPARRGRRSEPSRIGGQA